MQDTLTRADARNAILDCANRGRSRRNLKPLFMKHLHRAVFKVRQHSLVGNDVLVAAGFNPGVAAGVAAVRAAGSLS